MDTPRLIVVFVVLSVMMITLGVLHRYSRPAVSQTVNSGQPTSSLPDDQISIPQPEETHLTDQTPISPPPQECFETVPMEEELRNRNEIAARAAATSNIDGLVDAFSK